MRRSIRRSRSNARLYEALAERETDEASRELYRLQANRQRTRAAHKAARLFRLRARLPDGDPLAARAWRSLLMLCGPGAVGMWIEWREDRELTLIISVALTKARLARRLTRSTHQPPD